MERKMVMENPNKPLSEPDSTPLPTHTAFVIHNEHITLSPPLRSPDISPYSTEEHIRLSPTLGSPDISSYSNEQHIRLSPPLGSPDISPYSSSPHSKKDIGGHISMSPSTVDSAGNSPARSSSSSDHINNDRITEEKKLRSPGNGPPPPTAMVKRDAPKGPTENSVVLVEPMAVVERAVLEQPKAAVKTDSGPTVVEGGNIGGSRQRRYTNTPTLSILRGAKRENMVTKAALGLRIFGFLFCLVGFSVMAADRSQGWALDSFYRYREFRYCMSVDVIGFVYSAAQAVDLSYNLGTGKHSVHHPCQLRHYCDFGADQIIAYLLISASSSAVVRVND